MEVYDKEVVSQHPMRLLITITASLIVALLLFLHSLPPTHVKPCCASIDPFLQISVRASITNRTQDIGICIVAEKNTEWTELSVRRIRDMYPDVPIVLSTPVLRDHMLDIAQRHNITVVNLGPARTPRTDLKCLEMVARDTDRVAYIRPNTLIAYDVPRVPDGAAGIVSRRDRVPNVCHPNGPNENKVSLMIGTESVLSSSWIRSLDADTVALGREYPHQWISVMVECTQNHVFVDHELVKHLPDDVDTHNTFITE